MIKSAYRIVLFADNSCMDGINTTYNGAGMTALSTQARNQAQQSNNNPEDAGMAVLKQAMRQPEQQVMQLLAGLGANIDTYA